MKTLLAAAVAATLATGSAFAQTTIITEEAPAATTTTTTTTVTEELPGDVVTYVRENPIDPAPVLEGRIVDGYVVPPSVTLAPVRGYDGYSYFYQDGAPIIVDSNRRVVRIVR